MMTINEAIALMKNERTCIVKADTCDRDCAKCELLRKTEDLLSAYDMAIKALEQQPCEDTISRQAAIRWVKTECNPYGKPTLDFESGKKVIEHLKQMPSAQPERIKGHWIDIDKTHSKCDKCESVFEIASANGEINFCPNCGADMRGEQDE